MYYDFGFLLGNIVSVVIELRLFYYITNIKFKRLDILFAVFVSALGFLTTSDVSPFSVEIGTILDSLLVILSYYLYFFKRQKPLFTVASITFVRSIFTLLFTIEYILYRYTSFDLGIILFLLFIWLVYLIVSKNRKRINHFLTGDNYQIADWLIVYFYMCVVILNILESKPFKHQMETIILLVMAVQSIFIVALYVSSVQLQKKLLKKQEEKNMQVYVHDLEESEDRLRKFKHDYLNLLATLRTSAVINKDQEVIAELEKYTQKQINDSNIWRFKNVNHIHDLALKSLLVNKLGEINELGIKYSFECAKEITVFPANVKMFDLIRIIGIVFDNAIEESELLGIDKAEIKAMFYQEKPGELEFKIMNKCREKQNLNEIKKKGYTTKPEHHGYGLANIQEINDHYDNMFIEYRNQDDWFSFSLVIA